jgi:hypothetical protein
MRCDAMNPATLLHSSHQAGASRAPLAQSLARQLPGARHIELSLQNVEQLFNTMDPSPFHEKDLDHDAEEFIVSWAQEYHPNEPLDLVVHLERTPSGSDPTRLVTDAVHNYFAYRTRLNKLEFKRLMKQGRWSLVIGLCFLSLCLGAIQVFALKQSGTFPTFLSEGLTIAGWVAMWKPMEIYLYDWWPLRRRGLIFDKLSRMPIEVRNRE